ncbi:hypothetical protein ESOMN_v1c05770 [Williamsoniiplasma somnilux]|uniref:Lipoprotein n=1 Tax=Williamsoniiplasma somnilux TaxID=215578 RepID=A0A2K8NYR5_9MOLU|nr:lipoprotein [Williamsoniiplasma somnilux]ATZ18959.1 hypothetical protein ESOMN_v1c05770 [Williamsoniiplasma somnilux]
MKKLLTVLGTLGLTAVAGATVVSCGDKHKDAKDLSTLLKDFKATNETTENQIISALSKIEGLSKIKLDTDVTIKITKATNKAEGSILIKATEKSKLVKGQLTLKIEKLSNTNTEQGANEIIDLSEYFQQMVSKVNFFKKNGESIMAELPDQISFIPGLLVSFGPTNSAILNWEPVKDEEGQPTGEYALKGLNSTEEWSKLKDSIMSNQSEWMSYALRVLENGGWSSDQIKNLPQSVIEELEIDTLKIDSDKISSMQSILMDAIQVIIDDSITVQIETDKNGEQSWVISSSNSDKFKGTFKYSVL